MNTFKDMFSLTSKCLNYKIFKTEHCFKINLVLLRASCLPVLTLERQPIIYR